MISILNIQPLEANEHTMFNMVKYRIKRDLTRVLVLFTLFSSEEILLAIMCAPTFTEAYQSESLSRGLFNFEFRSS